MGLCGAEQHFTHVYVAGAWSCCAADNQCNPCSAR